MRWPWRLRGKIEPRPMVSREVELQTAKEILAEVFHARRGGQSVIFSEPLAYRKNIPVN